MTRDLKLEIAHVLFIDIVGYSKCATDEQSELLDALNEAVRSSSQVQVAERNGTLIELPTGDGMALVFRDGPEGPAQAAIEITKGAKASGTPLQLRMGIHSGTVNAVADVSGRPNVAGAGINLAQRVMDCGGAGYILVSSRTAEDLCQHRKWQPYLHDLGEADVKHGTKVHLFNFFGPDFGNSEPPLKTGRQPAAAGLSKHHRQVLYAGAVAFAAILVFATLFLTKIKHRVELVTPVQDKSIAVLPFENLSDDKGNAYFVDGIQDEILTRLAKVADLKVISRTSSQRFRSKPDNLPEIAKQLGVAHVLEGSAQRSADQVRVNVQLIKAASDAHLWAETYDRKLTDVFAVETEIATKIAETLQAKLSGAEHSAMAARPTENTEAHELYLKGRYFAGKRTAEDLQKALNYYNQALGKDHSYAASYAAISEAYALLQEYSTLPAAEVFPKARAAAEKALGLDPNSAEAHCSLGLVLQAADLNLAGAKQEFERAIALNPNYAGAHYFLGLVVLVPLGEFEKGIEEVKRAAELDPFSAIINANLGYCYSLAARYKEAVVQLERTVEIDTSFAYTVACLGLAHELQGDTEAARAAYEKAFAISHAYQPLVFLAHLYGVTGQRERALQLVTQVEEMERKDGIPWAFGHAVMQLGLGDNESAINWLERSYQAKETGIIMYIKVDQMLDPLRGNPRFEALANKIIPPPVSQ